MVKMDFGILGRLFPCLFPVRWCFVLGSIPGGTAPQAFILRFKAFRPSNGHRYGASRKNDIQGKIQAQAAQKKSLYIDNYIYRCYALGNYKVVKCF